MRAARTFIIAALAVVASCATPAPNEASRTGKTSQAADWTTGAVEPIRIRQGHTATLLGTGEVFVAGGRASPKTTEIIDPYTAKVVAGPDLLTARQIHTATMLLSGKVLLAGGMTETAELYDPVTRTTTATGSMAVARGGHSAIRLRSGKVLVTGGGTTGVATEIYDPAAGTWSAGPAPVEGTGFGALATLTDGRIVGASGTGTEVLDADATAWTKIDPGFPPADGVQTLTRLGGGRIACGWNKGCASVGGPPTCLSFTSILSADATSIVDGPNFNKGRDAFSAVRTVEGSVLFIGGDPPIPSQAAELLENGAAANLTLDGMLTAEHIGPTSTVLPGGDILVIGGAQAKLDRRPNPGKWADASFSLLHGREQHIATRLQDGTVLVAGGIQMMFTPPQSNGPVLDAEILDLVAGKATAVTGLPSAHVFATLTTLRDGRALLVGGNTADVAIYTPGGEFAAGPPLSTARTKHAATLLPSGKLLVSGGTGMPSPVEIFDPTSNTWTLGPTPAHAWSDFGTVLLPNGLVLFVGGGDAELFDEKTMTFRGTTAPGASREGGTAHLLPNGKAFVAGGTTLAAEVYDPVTETWAYTSGLSIQHIAELWNALPSGKLVSSGGHNNAIDGNGPSMRVFDPIAHPTGSFVDIPTGSQTGYAHSATLAGTGDVVQAGGHGCWGSCFGDSLAGIRLYGDGALATLRPEITDLPVTVTAGTKVQIVGTGFAFGAEASDGTHSASAVNHPTAVWVSDAGDAVVPSTILDFSDTTATWVVPTTALYGHGQLFVNVGGIYSRGRSVTITPALAATACANDAQCNTGFCTDGVCCDRRCDGLCEGCSKARKTTGEDGVCGAVPPGQDITGRCILKLGAACNGGNECATGFCAQGVCCDSTCDGQCLSCNQAGRVGICSGINEGACGAACDGDHTLKQVGVTDVDCAPYKCSGPQCSQTCASARDCVAPAVCSYDGHCVPPVTPPAGSDTVCGCRAVGAPARSSTGVAMLLGLAVVLLRRRRR